MYIKIEVSPVYTSTNWKICASDVEGGRTTSLTLTGWWNAVGSEEKEAVAKTQEVGLTC
jgi:hypothetical protein